MHRYETARFLIGFIEFVAWVVLVAGIIGAIYLYRQGMNAGFREGDFMMGMTFASPALLASFAALLLIVLIQHTRATLDTAVSSAEIAQLAREQLSILKGSPQLHGHMAAASASNNAQGQLPSGYAEMPVPDGSAISQDSAVSATKTGNAAAHSPKQAEKPVLATFSHRGRTVERTEDGYRVGHLEFENKEKALFYIENVSNRL